MNLSKAEFNIFCVDKDDNIIFSATIDINNDDIWTEKDLSFPLKDTKKIIWGVLALGHSASMDTQKLWLDKITLSVENTNLTFLNKFEVLPKIKDLNSVMKLNFNSDFEEDVFEHLQIPESKSIIGIGENIHGSKTLNQIEVELVKHLILNENCKLILLEACMYRLMLWDRFVKGYTNEEYIENIKKELSNTLFSPEVYTDFLIWLRNYNSVANEKVSIQGLMDHNYEWHNYLFDYLYTFYNDSTASIIAPILKNTDRGALSKALIEVESSEKEVKRILGEQEFFNYLYVLKKAINATQDNFNLSFYNFLYRDKSMAENATHLISLYTKDEQKTAIIAHHEHINKKIAPSGFPQIYPMGYYLNETHDEKYYALCLLPGKGSIFTLSNDMSTGEKFNINAPKSNSLEDLCLKTNLSSFFFLTQDMEDGNIYFRSIGNAYREGKEYVYGNIKEQSDAIIFVEQTLPIYPDSFKFDELNMSLTINNMVKQAQILRELDINTGLN